MNNERRCPRCDEETLQTWDELSDEERQVVKRLPATVDYQEKDRRTTHQWCTRCWYEATGGAEQLV